MNPYVSCDLCSISSSSSSSKSDATEDRSSPTCIAPYLTTVEPGNSSVFDTYMPFFGAGEFSPPKAHQTTSLSLSCCFSSLRVPIWGSWGVKLILPQWVRKRVDVDYADSGAEITAVVRPSSVHHWRSCSFMIFMLDAWPSAHQLSIWEVLDCCRYTRHKQK